MWKLNMCVWTNMKFDILLSNNITNLIYTQPDALRRRCDSTPTNLFRYVPLPWRPGYRQVFVAGIHIARAPHHHVIPSSQYSTSPKWSQFSRNSLLKHGFNGGEANISRKGLTRSTCNYVIIPIKNHKVDHVSSASAGIYIEASPFYTINTRLWTLFLPTRIWGKFQRQTLGVDKLSVYINNIMYK